MGTSIISFESATGCLAMGRLLKRERETSAMIPAIHILSGTLPGIAFTVFYLQKLYFASVSEILLDI